MADVLVEHDVAAAMRDGTVLRADVYRPVGDERWPVLLARLPYGKQMPTLIALLNPLAAARRGFVAVIQDTKGRFASEGDWEPWTFDENDRYDTVHDAVWPSRIVLPVVPTAETGSP